MRKERIKDKEHGNAFRDELTREFNMIKSEMKERNGNETE